MDGVSPSWEVLLCVQASVHAGTHKDQAGIHDD